MPDWLNECRHLLTHNSLTRYVREMIKKMQHHLEEPAAQLHYEKTDRYENVSITFTEATVPAVTICLDHAGNFNGLAGADISNYTTVAAGSHVVSAQLKDGFVRNRQGVMDMAVLWTDAARTAIADGVDATEAQAFAQAAAQLKAALCKNQHVSQGDINAIAHTFASYKLLPKKEKISL